MALVVVATVRGVIQQTDGIGDSVDAAMEQGSDELDVDEEALEDARAAAEETSAAVAEGFVTKVVSGVDALIGLASGLILGSLIMYYLLKDGTSIRRSVVSQFSPSIRDEVDAFVTDACQILRSYGRGRTAMSAIVSVVVGIASFLMGLPLVFTIVVVNFIGGYIPYIGAFLGGGLAVIVAYGEGGIGLAALMLVVVLAANLLLENFVEPRVMGRTLDIHPMLVIIVTALGGFLFGIVGLLLAVPFTVIAGNLIGRLRAGGFFTLVAEQAAAGHEEDARHTGKGERLVTSSNDQPSNSSPTFPNRSRRRPDSSRAAGRSRGLRGCGSRSRSSLESPRSPVTASSRTPHRTPSPSCSPSQRAHPHHARGHHDARGVPARRQIGRRHDDARLRGCVHHPRARLRR